MDQLMKTLEEYLVKKAPALPKNIKDMLVQYAPWLTVALIVLAAPAILAVLGLGSFMGGWGGYGYGYGYGSNYMISVLVLGAALVLRGLAIPGLFSRSKSGWNFMFYSALVNAAHDALIMSWGGLIIGTLVTLYVLFQVKSYYK